jgi:protein-disulfide isomerase
MERSTLVRLLVGVAIAVFLGFVAGRQQQLVDSQHEILREIQELKTSLRFQSAPAAPPLDFNLSIEGAAIKGNPNARLTLIEFSDFECPFCARYVRDSYPQLERDYVSTGKLQYVFRHFPLAGLHPNAVKAAEAAECGRVQGKFWPLHDRLFANQKLLEPASLLDHARAVMLDMKSFEACLDGQAASAVRADLDAGNRAGITATPTFFIGFAQADGSVHVVENIVGAKQYSAFQSVLDRLLASPAVR